MLFSELTNIFPHENRDVLKKIVATVSVLRNLQKFSLKKVSKNERLTKSMTILSKSIP